MSRIDIEAYFLRIGYAGDRAPTLATLQALHRAHTLAIPFENLNPWTGRRVSLVMEEVERKLVARRRGGYCFEQNRLFAAVLRQLGYELTTLLARVVWNQPAGAETARSHLILLVKIDGRRWIADVGFGGLGQTQALELLPEIVQPTSHESRRYVEGKSGIFTHQAQLSPERWEDLYRFDLVEALPIDFEVSNWFTNTHPDSIFRKTLMVTMPREDGRLVLAFGEFSRRTLDGGLEKRTITDDEDLRTILTEEFGLPVEDPAVRDAGLAALPFPGEPV